MSQNRVAELHSRAHNAKLNQWRSFRAERVTAIKSNGTTTTFAQES